MKTLRNCKLVKELTEGTQLTMADVVMDGGKIAQILPCGTQVSGAEEFMDLQGKTLLPGLIDAHVHLFMGKRNPWDKRDRLAIPAQRVLDCLKYAQFLLDLGFTTVRDVGDAQLFPGIATRNAINAGDFVGPRVKCSGLTIVPPTAGFDNIGYMLAIIQDANDMRRVVRDQFAHGADLIKLYGTGSMNSAASQPGRRLLEIDEIREAVRIADSKGSYCACHCHGAEAIEAMIDNGVSTIEHASFIDESSCKKLDGRTDKGIVLTIACSSREMEVIAGRSEEAIARLERINAERDVCLKNAYQNHDILIGWGTDMDITGQSQLPFLEWKERKERLGFANIDILKQATINSAKLMRMDDVIGTVKEGKYADFVVVDGDPVADISVMYRKPLHIIKDGALIR